MLCSVETLKTLENNPYKSKLKSNISKNPKSPKNARKKEEEKNLTKSQIILSSSFSAKKNMLPT